MNDEDDEDDETCEIAQFAISFVSFAAVFLRPFSCFAEKSKPFPLLYFAPLVVCVYACLLSSIYLHTAQVQALSQ